MFRTRTVNWMIWSNVIRTVIPCVNCHGEFFLVYIQPIRQISGYQHSSALALSTSCTQITVCCRSYLMPGRLCASIAILCSVDVVYFLNCDNKIVFWYCLPHKGTTSHPVANLCVIYYFLKFFFEVNFHCSIKADCVGYREIYMTMNERVYRGQRMKLAIVSS